MNIFINHIEINRSHELATTRCFQSNCLCRTTSLIYTVVHNKVHT